MKPTGLQIIYRIEKLHRGFVKFYDWLLIWKKHSFRWVLRLRIRCVINNYVSLYLFFSHPHVVYVFWSFSLVSSRQNRKIVCLCCFFTVSVEPPLPSDCGDSAERPKELSSNCYHPWVSQAFFDFASFPLEACSLPFLSVFWYWYGIPSIHRLSGNHKLFFDFASFLLETCSLPFLSVFWYWCGNLSVRSQIGSS